MDKEGFIKVFRSIAAKQHRVIRATLYGTVYIFYPSGIVGVV